MESEVSHTLSGGAAGLVRLLDALQAQLDASGAPPAVRSAVMIACDEVLANIVAHGVGDATVDVRVGDGRVAVAVVDRGPAFDPTAADPPDTDLPIEARDVGGLGIHLVREMMDEVAYERVDGANRLRFSKAWPVPSPS